MKDIIEEKLKQLDPILREKVELLLEELPLGMSRHFQQIIAKSSPKVIGFLLHKADEDAKKWEEKKKWAENLTGNLL